MIFPDNTRKIIFQRNFFGKTIFSGRLETENMVFHAVLEAIEKNPYIVNYWWAGVSNYVYSTIFVITKIYIFLLYITLVLLLIMWSQPAYLRKQ